MLAAIDPLTVAQASSSLSRTVAASSATASTQVIREVYLFGIEGRFLRVSSDRQDCNDAFPGAITPEYAISP